MGATDQPDVAITFRLRPEIHAALNRFAQRSERSQNGAANWALAEFLRTQGLLPKRTTPTEGSSS